MKLYCFLSPRHVSPGFVCHITQTTLKRIKFCLEIIQINYSPFLKLNGINVR